MPVYNTEQYLRQAIESVLAETYQHFEFLIYDDCSTDASSTIIKEYAQKDKRIKIFNGEKKAEKVVWIYKFLVDNSSGSYFIPTDSDDICLPQRLEILVNEAIKHPEAGLIFGKTVMINQDNTQILGYLGSRVDPYRLFQSNYVPDGASLISKQHYDMCGGYNENIEWAEDYELRLRLLELAPFIYIDKDVYLYRQYPTNYTAKKRAPKKEVLFKTGVVTKSLEKAEKFTREKISNLINHNKKINYSEYISLEYSAAYYRKYKKNIFKAYRLLRAMVYIEQNIINILKDSVLPVFLQVFYYLGGRKKVDKILNRMNSMVNKSEFVDKTVITGEMLRNGLIELGIRKDQKIIVHSSLSSFGYVLGGAKTVIGVLKDLIGENGLIMMPCFTYYTEHNNKKEEKYFDLDSPCSKDMGIIPEEFRKDPDVYRNFHPFTSFAFWGKNAQELANKYHIADSLSDKSPLGEVLNEGYILMLGSDFSTVSIIHTAEYIADVPYTGYSSEFNYIKNDQRKTTTLRRTGHSEEFRKIADHLDHYPSIKIGNAICCLIKADYLANTAVKILKSNPAYFLCDNMSCRTCQDRRSFLKIEEPS